ncbi:hypothetical protein HPB52_004222 [Rhipicephalus sanguineus]|uniref:Tick transposon n=1 Tax=Rhipicephalus sanguineus TaxID=34632 RepID=A0A9D4PMH2_RHISA|nr:hypothetical protein HPB52_004222 [Rhipicephalus sanguineus]
MRPLPSATSAHDQEAPSTGTLVHKSLVAKQHDLEFPDIPQTVVEILPRKGLNQPHCSPEAHNWEISTSDTLTGATRKRTKEARNYGNSARISPTLLNDPQQSPTRIVNSVCRDTSPDLAYCKNIAPARWETTCQRAGSDHYVIVVQVQTSAGKNVPNVLARIMERPKFREVRESEAPESITNLKEWTATLNDHVRRRTRESRAADETPARDSSHPHVGCTRKPAAQMAEATPQ